MKPKSDIMGWDESQEEAESEDSHQCLTNVPTGLNVAKHLSCKNRIYVSNESFLNLKLVQFIRVFLCLNHFEEQAEDLNI